MHRDFLARNSIEGPYDNSEHDLYRAARRFLGYYLTSPKFHHKKYEILEAVAQWVREELEVAKGTPYYLRPFNTKEFEKIENRAWLKIRGKQLNSAMINRLRSKLG